MKKTIGTEDCKPEYMAWYHARDRTTNPKHKFWYNYGGRGITMCDAWINDFWAFYQHIGPRPSPELTLERIDNDKGYEPGNVAWRTRREQQLNRRVFKPGPSGMLVTYNGVTKELRQWARETGMNTGTLWYRVYANWPEEDLFDTPDKHRRHMDARSRVSNK